MIPAQQRRSTIVFSLIILILALLILISAYIFKSSLSSKLFPKSQIQPKLIKELSLFKKTADLHSLLYYANLEYDPTTNLITQFNSGTTKGDIPELFKEKPASTSAYFVYKIEVVSDQNELIQTGYQIVPIKISKTDQGNLKFRVISMYRQNAMVKLYLTNNQQIWLGRMP